LRLPRARAGGSERLRSKGQAKAEAAQQDMRCRASAARRTRADALGPAPALALDRPHRLLRGSGSGAGSLQPPGPPGRRRMRKRSRRHTCSLHTAQTQQKRVSAAPSSLLPALVWVIPVSGAFPKPLAPPSPPLSAHGDWCVLLSVSVCVLVCAAVAVSSALSLRGRLWRQRPPAVVGDCRRDGDAR
jgi:hypothetical protein